MCRSASSDHGHGQVVKPSSPRFAVPNVAFAARTAAIDTLLAPYSVVCGTGSWIEAHLVARLGHLQGIPNLQGCGTTVHEVLDLCRRAPEPVLVVLSGSIARDHGRELCLQLKALSATTKICCLIDLHQPAALATTLPCDAVIAAASFGSGAVHDALVAIGQGQRYQDPALLPMAQELQLKPRQQQVLELLALGYSNKQIGNELNIAAVTVRDVVQQLCQIFAALNRTDVVFKASCAGVLRPPSAPPSPAVQPPSPGGLR